LASVRLVNVGKRYGSKTALDGLSFEVRDKEFFVIAGPPGAGATTILRIIAGLEKPDTGEVYIGDQLVNDIEPKDRDVAMVFENLALYPNKTGFGNIAFPLRQRKVPDDEIRSRVQEVAKMLKIEEILDRLPITYSGGELQRVALARAMVRRPKVYLLDQPLANLDALIRANMRAELKRLVREIGQTIIYTTHDQIEAVSMGDRIAVINAGLIKQLDSPGAVYSKPRNKFVARFIGSPRMNFIDCTYQVKDGRGLLVHDSFHLDVTPLRDAIGRIANDSELILGIRPEDIHAELSQKSKEAFEVSVYVAEPMGSRTLVSVLVGKDLIRTLIPGEIMLGSGDKVWLEFDSDKIHLFDKKTEEVIV